MKFLIYILYSDTLLLLSEFQMLLFYWIKKMIITIIMTMTQMFLLLLNNLIWLTFASVDRPVPKIAITTFFKVPFSKRIYFQYPYLIFCRERNDYICKYNKKNVLNFIEKFCITMNNPNVTKTSKLFLLFTLWDSFTIIAGNVHHQKHQYQNVIH